MTPFVSYTTRIPAPFVNVSEAMYFTPMLRLSSLLMDHTDCGESGSDTVGWSGEEGYTFMRRPSRSSKMAPSICAIPDSPSVTSQLTMYVELLVWYLRSSLGPEPRPSIMYDTCGGVKSII